MQRCPNGSCLDESEKARSNLDNLSCIKMLQWATRKEADLSFFKISYLGTISRLQGEYLKHHRYIDLKAGETIKSKRLLPILYIYIPQF